METTVSMVLTLVSLLCNNIMNGKPCLIICNLAIFVQYCNLTIVPKFSPGENVCHICHANVLDNRNHYVRAEILIRLCT